MYHFKNYAVFLWSAVALFALFFAFGESSSRFGKMAVPATVLPLCVAKRFRQGRLLAFGRSGPNLVCIGRFDFIGAALLDKLQPGAKIELIPLGRASNEPIETTFVGCATTPQGGALILWLEENEKMHDFAVEQTALKRAGFNACVAFSSWRVK